MDIYAGIDGTGPGNDAVYALDFADSFVSQLSRSSRFSARYYLRGPTWEGGTARTLSEAMHREIETRLHLPGAAPVTRIVLAGYSRGGAIAIRTCRELAKHGHKVHALLLFDAVDMSLAIEAKRIPRNVRYCFHAIRHPQSRSRTSWGNCGTEREVRDDNITLYQWQHFMCTHGGMGGTPWKHADRDGIINEALTGEGVSDSFTRLRHARAEHARRTGGLGGSPLGALADLADASNQLHRNAGRTTITLQQDREESARVGTWMFSKLDWAMKQSAPKVAVPVG